MHNSKLVILKKKKKKHRKTTYIRIPFSQSNEHYVLKFIKILQGSAKEKYSFVIICSLLNLKDKTIHVSSLVYEEKCICGENYESSVKQGTTLPQDKVSIVIQLKVQSQQSTSINFFEHRKIFRRNPKIFIQKAS